MKTNILIKNMVCHRCILSIEHILTDLHFDKFQVSLGKVLVFEPLEEAKLNEFKQRIEEVGFVMLNNKEDILIEKVKIILQYVLNSQDFSRKKLSDIIQDKIGFSYAKISKLFSITEGITIEKYFVNLRVEKVKEFIFYNELSISEIAYELGYSTPQHLSRQFKQVTGLTTSQFKKMVNRTEFDKI